MEVLLTWLAPLIAAWAGKYGVIVTVITWIGTLRLLVKPLMSVAKVIAATTKSTKDDEVLVKVETSKWYGYVLYVLDWVASIKMYPEEVKKVVP